MDQDRSVYMEHGGKLANITLRFMVSDIFLPQVVKPGALMLERSECGAVKSTAKRLASLRRCCLVA
jgi:hypothetical protein